jgi:hypothetical protein
MTRRTHEEFTRIWWAASITSKTAPTVAELAAATDISAFVPKDGLKIGSTNNKVKNDDITTAFMSEIPGSYGNALTLTCFRDDTTDTAWTLFQTRNTVGFLIIRRMIAVTTAVAIGQKVEVYPGATGQPTLHDTAENERVKFGVDIMVSAPPALVATVA